MQLGPVLDCLDHPLLCPVTCLPLLLDGAVRAERARVPDLGPALSAASGPAAFVLTGEAPLPFCFLGEEPAPNRRLRRSQQISYLTDLQVLGVQLASLLL